MKFLLVTALLMNLFLEDPDPKKDVSITSGTGKCIAPLRLKKIKNNSDSKTIIVVVNQIVMIEGTRSTLTITDTLPPKQEKDLGCAGCIADGAGNECTIFSIKSASYFHP